MEAEGIVGLPDRLRIYKTSELARIFEVSAVQVSSWKGGKAFPAAAKYEKLADLLSVDPGTIVRMATMYRRNRDKREAIAA